MTGLEYKYIIISNEKEKPYLRHVRHSHPWHIAIFLVLIDLKGSVLNKIIIIIIAHHESEINNTGGGFSKIVSMPSAEKRKGNIVNNNLHITVIF